jgi:CubicO group peptidase (beta-lactamase class C family)
MADLKQETDPEEVGLDSGRLPRIDRHFSRYVDDGRLPGWLILVARHGRIAHLSTYGMRDRERGLPVETDTLWRMYSMTKPVTSVAAMMLAEEGAFELNDPVATVLPSFGDLRVWRGGSLSDPTPVTTPATEPMRMWHLLTHTAGLTYGLHDAHPVAHPADAFYRRAGFDPPWTRPGLDLAGACEEWAEIPLLFEPGQEWRYSYATDVLGRVIEVVSGQTLDDFFQSRIFEPLGMTDTGFWVEAERADRLGALYVGRPAAPSPDTGRALERPAFLSGGAGLIGSAADYHRFASMLLGKGQLGGVRLLSPRTLEYMTRNHLSDGPVLETFVRSQFPEPSFTGVGYGLGVAVTTDPVAAKMPGSAGEYGWGGAASTTFWVDPSQDLTAIFLTQVLDSGIHPIRHRLKGLVSQAIVD